MTQGEGFKKAKENGLFDKHNLRDEEFYMLYKAIARMTNISWEAKALLTLVMSYEMNGLTFFATNGRISEELGMSLATVKRQLKVLKGAGYIRMFKVYKGINYIYREIVTEKLEVDRRIKADSADLKKVEC